MHSKAASNCSNARSQHQQWNYTWVQKGSLNFVTLPKASTAWSSPSTRRTNFKRTLNKYTFLTERANKAFNKIKKHFSSPPIITFLDSPDSTIPQVISFPTKRLSVLNLYIDNIKNFIWTILVFSSFCLTSSTLMFSFFLCYHTWFITPTSLKYPNHSMKFICTSFDTGNIQLSEDFNWIKIWEV